MCGLRFKLKKQRGFHRRDPPIIDPLECGFSYRKKKKGKNAAHILVILSDIQDLVKKSKTKVCQIILCVVVKSY